MTVLHALGAVGIGAVLTAVVGGLFARRRTRSEAGKLDADAAKTIADAATALVAPLSAQLGAMDARLTAAEQRVGVLENENRAILRRDASKLEYIRTLLRRWAECLPGHAPPEPPELLREELNL